MPEIIKPSQEINEAQSQKPVDANHLGFFLAHSFRHAQGDGNVLQLYIFSYFRAVHPEFIPTSEQIEQAQSRAADIMSIYFGNQAPIVNNHIPMENPAIDIGAKAYGSTLGEWISREIIPLKEIIIPSIAESVILRDAYYLQRENGRGKTPSKTVHTNTDSWLSYLCHYALNGNPTGIEEFDQMYQDIKSYLSKSPHMSDEVDASLDLVLRVHNQKHPGQEVEFPPVPTISPNL